MSRSPRTTATRTAAAAVVAAALALVPTGVLAQDGPALPEQAAEPAQEKAAQGAPRELPEQAAEPAQANAAQAADPARGALPEQAGDPARRALPEQAADPARGALPEQAADAAGRGRPDQQDRDAKPARDGAEAKDEDTDNDNDNNGFPGTIKVAFPTADGAPGNDAKPGCTVRLDFYGFKPATYHAEFTAIPPTGGTLGVIASGDVAVDGDRTPASRLQDSALFTLDVSRLEPSNQGYHVRVEVTRPGQPGNGAKTKVFFFDCAPSTASSSTAGGAPAQTGPRGTPVTGTGGGAGTTTTGTTTTGTTTTGTTTGTTTTGTTATGATGAVPVTGVAGGGATLGVPELAVQQQAGAQQQAAVQQRAGAQQQAAVQQRAGTAPAVPRGGFATGAGGTAGMPVPLPAGLALGTALVAAGALLRRRGATS